MLPETVIVMKWVPVHLVAEPLPQSVLSNILTKNLHKKDLTGCNTIFVLANARIHAGKCLSSSPIFLK